MRGLPATALRMPLDQADGLRRLFAGRGRQVLALAANPHVPFGGLVLDRVAAVLAAQGRQVLVVDAAASAPPPHELARLDLAACIERLSPARGLPAGARPAAGLRGHPRLGRRLHRRAAAGRARKPRCVLLHAERLDLARLLKRRAVRPLLMGADHPESIKHAYASCKLLAQRCGLMSFDLLLAASPLSPRAAGIAASLAQLRRRLPGRRAARLGADRPRRRPRPGARRRRWRACWRPNWNSTSCRAPPAGASRRAAPAARRTEPAPTRHPIEADTMYTAKGQLDAGALLKQYSPLVRRLAHQMIAKLPANVELDDLIQVGMIGLSDALSRFDAAQGVQFETFATQRIRGAMLDELRGNDWMSRGDRRHQRSIEAAVHKLEQRHGRAPSESEIAREMGLSLADYQELLGKVRGTQLIYLEDMSGDEADDDYLDRHVADADANPMARLQDQRMREALVEAIKNLPEREQYVMSMYYEHDMNLKEIAAVLGVTESRVCQLHSQSIARLRTRLREW